MILDNQQSRITGFVLGSLLIIFGVLAHIETVIDLDAWIGVALLTIGAIGIYFIYARDRNQKWLLVITYVMLAIAGLVTLLELGVLQDAFVVTYVLMAIALPFYVSYFSNRENWGLLVPAYVPQNMDVCAGRSSRRSY